MNILYITYGLPYPPIGGAKVRDFYLLNSLSKHHSVTCVCLLESADVMKADSSFKHLGIQITTFPQQTRVWIRIKTLIYFFITDKPIAAADFFNAQMFAWIEDFAKTRSIDFVQVEHSFLAQYIRALPESLRKRSLIDLHNIGEVQYQRIAELPQPFVRRMIALLKARLMRNWELQALSLFARISTVSEREAEWIHARNPKLRTSAIKNGVDTKQCLVLPEGDESESLLFVGTMGYSPNVDAMLWFCEAILPLVRKSVPRLRLEIVGRNPTAEVQSLTALDGVGVSGLVEDIRPFYQNARVVIVPLRAGGGTRLKILEAMSFGRAVVSTRLGAEGLNVVDGEHLMIADSPLEFADKIKSLLLDGDLRRSITDRARRFVEKNHDWERIGDELLNCISEFGN